MIHLTRLTGRPLIVNADLVWTIEATPDTILTFVNGDKLVVKEPVGDVVERVIEYRRAVGKLVVHHRGDEQKIAVREEETQ